MKKLISVSCLTILIVLSFSGCKTAVPLIPLVPKATLTAEQIKSLEKSEADTAHAIYISSIKEDSIRALTQPHVTNTFVEEPLRNALSSLSSITKINIIPDASVEGNVSVFLENVPLERALKMVLYPGGYSYRYIKQGNYYLVGKCLPENSSFEALTVTKTIKTNRAAHQVLEQLSEYYKPYVQSGKEGNILTLNGPDNIISRIERDVRLIDVSRRQVEISAKFVVVQWEKGSNIGMQWGDINLDATGLASLIKGAASSLSSNFSSSLSNILQTSGYKTKVNIIAEPRIVVEEGSEANLNITEEHTVQIMSGGGTAYNYFTSKDIAVGIKMKVIPNVTRDGMIRLDLSPELSDIVGQDEFKAAGTNQKIPVVDRRSTNTIIKVNNDQSFAIGGLVMKSKKVTSSGIPLLSTFPIIGKLIFGGSNKAQKDQELVIFITARIIG